MSLPASSTTTGSGSLDPLAGESLLVVMVNYRLADHIEAQLVQGRLASHRVLLIDNASQPERIRDLARRHRTELLLLDVNHGFAGAVNRGLAAAAPAPQVLLLNPDVSIDARDLAVLRKELLERRLTAITPLLVTPEGTTQVGTAGGPVSLAAFAAYFLCVSHLFRQARGIFYTRRQLAAGMEPTWLCMACLLGQGDAFARYGPIPERELVYAEDVAWGVNARRHGARFAVLSDVRAVHEQGAAGASWRWRGALARLAKREIGPLGGGLAGACMWLGLGLRRLAGRRF